MSKFNIKPSYDSSEPFRPKSVEKNNPLLDNSIRDRSYSQDKLSFESSKLNNFASPTAMSSPFGQSTSKVPASPVL